MPAVNVSFGLALRHDGWVPEAELGAELPPDVTDAEEPAGAVLIGDDVRMEDALTPLALWLCFNAVVELAAGRPATVEAYTYHGKTRLVPHGDSVEISGDLVPTVSLDRASLLEGLVACGERIRDFFAHLGPPYDESAKLLEAPGRRARAAL